MIELYKKNIAFCSSVAELKKYIFELRLFFLEHKFARSENQQAFLKGFVAKAINLLETEENLLKKRLLLTILIYAYYGLQDFEPLIVTEKKRIELLDRNWAAAHLSPFLVFAYHRNLLWIFLSNKQYKEHLHLLDNVKNVQSLSLLQNSDFYAVKLNIAAALSTMYAEVNQQK